MSIDHTLFRRVMSHLATGVTVVTTTTNEQPVGITVSSFTSLSLEPTLILICIEQRVAIHAVIAQAAMFAVNILADDQEQVSNQFADPRTERARFALGSYMLSTHGLPILTGSLATLECRVVNAFPGGDHTIYVGEVIAAETGPGQPLIYYHSCYRGLA